MAEFTINLYYDGKALLIERVRDNRVLGVEERVVEPDRLEGNVLGIAGRSPGGVICKNFTIIGSSGGYALKSQPSYER